MTAITSLLHASYTLVRAVTTAPISRHSLNISPTCAHLSASRTGTPGSCHVPPAHLAMAHRIITQVVITGSRVFGRAFAEAWRQASASQRYAAASASAASSRSSSSTSASSSDPSSGNPYATHASHGLTLDEACKILNVPAPQRSTHGGVEAEEEAARVLERFKKLFDLNDPKKGGSFYLQSKILRARERIEMEVREFEEEVEMHEARRDLPKMYR